MPCTKENVIPLLPGLRTKGHAIAGRYRVDRLLGTSSSGYVIAARHLVLRRRVALKILASTPARSSTQRRQLEAAHRAASLGSEHVARIVDTGFTEDGLAFIATEWLEGRTLADELAARSQLPPEEAVGWILQACEGLAAAHAAGLVHADLKPRNLFLAERASADLAERASADGAYDEARSVLVARTLKILDFGTPMALAEDGDGADVSTAWFASPAYLAPEQLRDPENIDARADIWALGVVLHQLIAGALPFSAETVAGMFVAVAYDEPALLAAEGVSFDLARVVKSCLAKDPAARPLDVAALARALSPFAGEAGAALAARVEAAFSAPSVPSASANARPIEAPSLEPLADDPTEGRERKAPNAKRAGAKRHRSAIVVGLAGCGLAALGILGASWGRADNAERFERDPGGSAKAASTEEADPLPFTPHALDPQAFDPSSGHASEVDVTPVAALPDSAKGAARPTPRALDTEPRRREGSTAISRPRAASNSPGRMKASLSVREDPYTDGFTHPQRLNDRRLKK